MSLIVISEDYGELEHISAVIKNNGYKKTKQCENGLVFYPEKSVGSI